MKLQVYVMLCVTLLLSISCATFRTDRKAVQTTHVYRAPETDSVIVKVVESAVRPVEKFLEISASTLNPVSVGIGSALNALGVGIGSALTIGPTGDHAVSRNTLVGYDDADISSSVSTIMLPTKQMAVKSGDIHGSDDNKMDDKNKDDSTNKDDGAETSLEDINDEVDRITVTAPTLIYDAPKSFLQRVETRSPLALPLLNTKIEE